MQNAWIVVQQVAVMALIVLVGFSLVRFGKMKTDVTLGLSNLLVYAVLPCVIIGAMQRDFDPDEARLLLLSAVLTVLSYIICITFAQLVLRRKGRPNTGLERFAVVQPNTGYVGIPLVQAVLGADGVFLLTAYIVIFNLIMFSYGRYQLSCDGEERGLVKAASPFSPESILRSAVNPASVSVVIGLGMYLLGIRLPAVPMAVVNGLSGLNSVVSMLLIGIFLSQIDFRFLRHFSRGFIICLVRLVVLPVILMAVLAVIRLGWLTADEMLLKTTIVIAASTPVAVAASFMAELCGADNLYGTNLVVVSTLLSILTMPLILLLWEGICAVL